jgi:hypothetical protein
MAKDPRAMEAKARSGADPKLTGGNAPTEGETSDRGHLCEGA